MTRETKTLQFQVKAVGVKTNEFGQELGEIEAYGAMFNNIDEGNDRINPGSFKRTIQNSKARAKARKKLYMLKMLWQHDDHEVIGGWFDLSEDTAGLLAKGDVLLSTRRGREYYDLAKAGMIDEFSIIYDVPQGGAKYDKSGVRDLTEIRLFSIDPVTFAMNDTTYTVGVKANKGTAKRMDKKDFNDRYRQQCISDWQYDDWQALITALKQSVMDTFAIGDTPQTDLIDIILNDSQDGKGFISALKDYVQAGIDLDYANYLQEQQSIGSSYYLGYMSRHASLQGKAGRSISAANQQLIDDHVDHMKALATAHAKAVRTAADDFASVMQGAEPTYVAPNAGTPDEQEGKQATRGASFVPPQTRSPQARSSSRQDTAHEEEADLANALTTLRALRPAS